MRRPLAVWWLIFVFNKKLWHYFLFQVFVFFCFCSCLVVWERSLISYYIEFVCFYSFIYLFIVSFYSFAAFFISFPLYLISFSPPPPSLSLYLPTRQVKDFTSTFEEKKTHDHCLLFMNTIFFKEKTIVNARLHVPIPVNEDEDVPATTFRLRVYNNDNAEEVSEMSAWMTGWVSVCVVYTINNNMNTSLCSQLLFLTHKHNINTHTHTLLHKHIYTHSHSRILSRMCIHLLSSSLCISH